MAFQEISNVSIRGISACVPKYTENNLDLGLFGSVEEAKKFIEYTGVLERHIVKGTNLCTSDLCYHAAKRLLERLDWDAKEIDCLIYVTQTPDYILPATSCILQSRLNLSIDCYSLDISLGCSGWVYGLSVISSLMSTGTMRKGLLLAGDTTSVTKSNKDKSTYPLFGDAGTATALEYKENCQSLYFHTGTDGTGYDAIIIPDGGFRNFPTSSSFIEREVEPGIFRNRMQSILNGPAVFTFGISKAPRSIKALVENYKISMDEVDFFVFHQANSFMNEKIRQKLKIEPHKVPNSIGKFGNTSSASIPLTIVSELRDVKNVGQKKIIACAFGVGLSWATTYFVAENLQLTDVIEI